MKRTDEESAAFFGVVQVDGGLGRFLLFGSLFFLFFFHCIVVIVVVAFFGLRNLLLLLLLLIFFLLLLFFLLLFLLLLPVLRLAHRLVAHDHTSLSLTPTPLTHAHRHAIQRRDRVLHVLVAVALHEAVAQTPLAARLLARRQQHVVHGNALAEQIVQLRLAYLRLRAMRMVR